ncbi:hypothetical protein E4T39_06683 [Aureobasidium subglaciale]|nr:hypothetical protein E4T39_06683 [Aureobasidium subglaciale]
MSLSTSTNDQTRYKFIYFVPPSSLAATKEAIFATNVAGRFPASEPLYTNVSWSSSGTGQFIPSPTSCPHTGTPGHPEILEEIKVEMQITGEENIKTVVKVLKE